MFWIVLIDIVIIGIFIVLPYVLETRAENKYFEKLEEEEDEIEKLI